MELVLEDGAWKVAPIVRAVIGARRGRRAARRLFTKGPSAPVGDISPDE